MQAELHVIVETALTVTPPKVYTVLVLAHPCGTASILL